MYDPIKYHQTSAENGDKKENKLGGVLVGLRYKILIPAKGKHKKKKRNKMN